MATVFQSVVVEVKVKLANKTFLSLLLFIEAVSTCPIRRGEEWQFLHIFVADSMLHHSV